MDTNSPTLQKYKHCKIESNFETKYLHIQAYTGATETSNMPIKRD